MKTIGSILGALAGIAVVGGALFWLSGGLRDRVAPGVIEMEAAAIRSGASLATVEEVTGPVSEWTSGAVASARQTVIASRILARIEEIEVRAGDRVAAGDLLATLDARDLEARRAQAAEALRAARARRDLAESEKARAEQLFERGVVTQQRLDQAVAELRAASADVDRLEQSVSEAETALSYTEIRAPVAGLVVDRLAEPGDTAAPGTPLLRIYDPTTLRVEVPVRESLALNLKVGDGLAVEIPATGGRVAGKVAEIVPFAEPGARTLLVKVALPERPRLYAGLFARVAVPAGSRTRLLVPAAAIERIGQLDFATVVDAGRPERRAVTLGEYRRDGLLEVLSGLAAGEQVARVGAPAIR